MATATPDQVRAGLQKVTQAAQDATEAVAATGTTPSAVRASLFSATPLIVDNYGAGAGALAAEWYDQLRAAADPSKPFSVEVLHVIDDRKLMDSVAWATQPLYDLEQQIVAEAEKLLQQATEDAMNRLLPEIQKQVAAGFRDTVIGNVQKDPAAHGWRRYAQPDACKFCLMLADRGAVYTEATADFAAHTNCHCLAGPSFATNEPLASAIQYVASSKTRTAKQNADLRAYLNKNFPDARG